MGVNVVAVVSVFVVVRAGINVAVAMRMRTIADSPYQSPCRISQPESKKQPPGDVAAALLPQFKLVQRRPQNDSDPTQRDGAENVSAAKTNTQFLPSR